MLADRIDLVFAVLGAALAAAAALLLAPGVERTLATLPLVLLLPGLAITGLAVRPMDILPRVLAAIALSMAVVIGTGLALHFTGPIDADRWAVALAGITIAVALVGFFVPRAAAAEGSLLAAATNAVRTRGSLLAAFVLALAVVAAVLSVVRAREGFEAVQDRYTLLSVVPNPQNSREATMVLENREGRPMAYSMTTKVAGKIVQQWPNIPLEPGEQWTAKASLPEPRVMDGPSIFEVRRLDKPAVVYRKARFWPKDAR
jgi:hypothetical protein